MFIDSEKLIKTINEDEERILREMPNCDYKNGILDGIKLMKENIKLEELKKEI